MTSADASLAQTHRKTAMFLYTRHWKLAVAALKPMEVLRYDDDHCGEAGLSDACDDRSSDLQLYACD